MRDCLKCDALHSGNERGRRRKDPLSACLSWIHGWANLHDPSLIIQSPSKPHETANVRYHADNEAADLKDFKRALKILARVIAKMEESA